MNNTALNLDAILVEGLVDTRCWNLLVQLGNEAGLAEVGRRFERDITDESEELALLRSWIENYCQIP